MLQLPSNWHQVTLVQYNELAQLDEVEWDSATEKVMESLAILCNTGADDPEIEQLSVDQLFELFGNIKWLKTAPPLSVSQTWNQLSLKPWNLLTLGEFIDIENLAMSSATPSINMLCAVAYKQSKTNSWGVTEWEPYQYDVYARAEQFEHLPVTKALGLLKSYGDFRHSFMKSYEQLFSDAGVQDKELDTAELAGLDGLELINAKKGLEKERKMLKWSWESTIWHLSNQDITKFDAIFNTSLIMVFNILSMRHTLDDKS